MPHTVQRTTRARSQIVHIPAETQLTVLTRAVDAIYDVAEVSRAIAWPESEAARRKLARPCQNRQHL
eukprot:6550801-Alexandrium_andersonii.AAC.1